VEDATDLVWIAPGLAGGVVNALVELTDLVDRRPTAVLDEAIGELTREFQGEGHAGADPDRDRLLYRVGLGGGVRYLVDLALKGEAVVGPEAAEDANNIAEAAKPLAWLGEGDADGVVEGTITLAAGAETEVEAAPGDEVEGRRLFRHDGWKAVGN